MHRIDLLIKYLDNIILICIDLIELYPIKFFLSFDLKTIPQYLFPGRYYRFHILQPFQHKLMLMWRVYLFQLKKLERGEAFQLILKIL